MDHTDEVPNAISNEVTVAPMPSVLPKTLTFVGDMKKWPSIADMDIFSYLIERRACDLREMKAYKSTLAYNYFLSECVGKVFVAETEDNTYLKGIVRPSQSIHETYNCWLLTKKTGTILTAGCECKAGNSSVCSHISAILYKVSYAQSRGMCGEKCTDTQQKWNAGTSRNVLPSTISTTNFRSPKRKMQLETYVEIVESSCPSPPKKFSSTEELLGFWQNSDLANTIKILGTIINTVLTAPSLETNTESGSELQKNLEEYESHTDHSLINPPDILCAPCKLVYQGLVQGTEESYKKLELATVSQSTATDLQNLKMWKFSRKVRITASSASNVPKRTSTDPSRFLENHLFSKFGGNADTNRGICDEKEAISWYEKSTNVTIRKVGSTVSRKSPWLSASADGVYNESIIEVKCPDPRKFDSYLAKKSYDICKNSSAEFELRKNKPYYTQIQLTMYCLEKEKCIFLVYLGPSRDPIVLNVSYDSNFVSSKLEFLRDFYFKKLLPHIVTNIKNKNLIVPSEYSNIFTYVEN